jgi:adenine/guanine/hypoxanthine permease
VLGGGAILSSLILASVAVFVIERKFLRAAAFALAGAMLTFFGFMHGEQIGIAESPAVALSYLLVSGVLAGCTRRAVTRSSRADEAPQAIPQPAD